MTRKTIRNLSHFINIGSRYLLYADFDNGKDTKIELFEYILHEVLDTGYLARWQGGFTLCIADTQQCVLCYITFFDDYVCVDLNFDFLNYNYLALQFIYFLFDEYYYFYGGD